MGKPKKFTGEQMVKFLELYRDCEVLWNYEHPKYKNSRARENAFHHIAEEMDIAGFGPSEVTRKIRIVRNTYTQEKNKVRKSIKSEMMTTGEIYTPQLSWYNIADSFLNSVTKLGELPNMQIRIFEKHDRSKMFISTIDLKFFDQLKQDQSLHVTFSGFVDNLAKILRECQNGKLEISVTEEKGQFCLQFYEHRQFKNLIHLSLPLREAPMSLVNFYMNRLLEDVLKENLSLEKKISHFQFQTNIKAEEATHLKNENMRLNKEITEREKKMSAHFQKEIDKLHERIREILEEKRLEEAKHKESLAGLQSKYDQFQMKNSQLAEEKMQEVRRCEVLREEVSCLKSNLANLKELNEKLHSELASVKNLERKNEMHLKDAKHTIHELQENLRKCEKIQSELSAELEAERKICSTKRQALEIATEEIEKANDIISKQGKELINLRKLLDLRTEVALNQEVAMKEKEKEILMQKRQLEHLQSVIDHYHETSLDFPKKLESLKNLADQIENKYSQRLSELKQKICGNENETGRKSLK